MDNLKFEGATLLSVYEARTLLSEEGRKYPHWWWLRSHGIFRDLVAYVLYDGSILQAGGIVASEGCVRPALKISPESSGYKIGDTFSFGGKRFRIISDNLAFCLEDIGFCCFREDYKAFNANVHDASDVKRFVDAWFEKAVREYKHSRLPLAPGTDY